MNSLRVALVLALTASLFASTAMGAHAPRTESRSYFGNNDALPLTEFDNVCAGGQETLVKANHVGGACFWLDATETSVSLRIQDKLGHRVGATYSFTTLSGEYVAGSFCSSTTLSVPEGAYLLSVAINGPYRGPLTCVGSTGIGVSGSIIASFL